jgi:hypothetical protein
MFMFVHGVHEKNVNIRINKTFPKLGGFELADCQWLFKRSSTMFFKAEYYLNL